MVISGRLIVHAPVQELPGIPELKPDKLLPLLATIASEPSITSELREKLRAHKTEIKACIDKIRSLEQDQVHMQTRHRQQKELLCEQIAAAGATANERRVITARLRGAASSDVLAPTPQLEDGAAVALVRVEQRLKGGRHGGPHAVYYVRSTDAPQSSRPVQVEAEGLILDAGTKASVISAERSSIGSDLPADLISLRGRSLTIRVRADIIGHARINM